MKRKLEIITCWLEVWLCWIPCLLTRKWFFRQVGGWRETVATRFVQGWYGTGRYLGELLKGNMKSNYDKIRGDIKLCIDCQFCNQQQDRITQCHHWTVAKMDVVDGKIYGPSCDSMRDGNAKFKCGKTAKLWEAL